MRDARREENESQRIKSGVNATKYQGISFPSSQENHFISHNTRYINEVYFFNSRIIVNVWAKREKSKSQVVEMIHFLKDKRSVKLG
jgi:hypothetical protein